jgi:hypothetical protein
MASQSQLHIASFCKFFHSDGIHNNLTGNRDGDQMHCHYMKGYDVCADGELQPRILDRQAAITIIRE